MFCLMTVHKDVRTEQFQRDEAHESSFLGLELHERRENTVSMPGSKPQKVNPPLSPVSLWTMGRGYKVDDSYCAGPHHKPKCQVVGV